MPRRPPGYKPQLRQPKPGGRPNLVAGPDRLSKDALGIAFTTLKEVGVLPTNVSAARLVELISNDETKSLVEPNGAYLSITYVPPNTVSAEKLSNRIHYSAQLLAETSSSKAKYLPEQVVFVRGSSEIILAALSASHHVRVHAYLDYLVEEYGWSRRITNLIGQFAVLLHASDKSFHRNLSPSEVAAEMLIFQKDIADHEVRVRGLLSSRSEQR